MISGPANAFIIDRAAGIARPARAPAKYYLYDLG